MQAICKALFPCLSALAIAASKSNSSLRHLHVNAYIMHINYVHGIRACIIIHVCMYIAWYYIHVE